MSVKKLGSFCPKVGCAFFSILVIVSFCYLTEFDYCGVFLSRIPSVLRHPEVNFSTLHMKVIVLTVNMFLRFFSIEI